MTTAEAAKRTENEQTLIPDILRKQTEAFFKVQSKKCLNRVDELNRTKLEKYFDYSKKFTFIHYESRIERANDIGNEKAQKAIRLAEEFLGPDNRDYWLLCMDSRINGTVVSSKPPHVGGVLKTASADVSAFSLSEIPGEIDINYEHPIVQQIINLLINNPGKTLYYVMDSHVGCAARGAANTIEGGADDNGLYADILSKKLIAQGIPLIKQKLEREGRSAANITPIFTSYDPHDGSMWMGLENCMNERLVTENGFTPIILKAFNSDGRAINSLSLLKEPKVLEILKQTIKPVNFRTHYPESMLSNWQALTTLYENGNGSLFLYLVDKVTALYSSTEQNDPHFIQHKAKLLLKNMVTRYSIAQDHEGHGHWPYENHREEMIVLTEGGYGPFNGPDAFSLYSHDDSSTIINEIKLATGLTRHFRSNGNSPDRLSEFGLHTIDFKNAPIVISVKGIARDIALETWPELEKLDLTTTLSTIDFKKKLTSAQLISQIAPGREQKMIFEKSLQFSTLIYEMYERMYDFMQDKQLKEMILNGNVIIVNTIVDRDRRPRFVVPITV